jgi:uncharacterized protein with ParB-like and HNH nuclease domain
VKPDKLTVFDVFSKEKRFIIPLFQRSYVWNEQDQWEPLWEDISGRAKAHLDRLDMAVEGEVRSHFLGAVVLNVTKTPGRGIARSDVIDGQQRLTTLQLFLSALRDLSEELKAEKSDRELFKRLTRNPDCEDDSDELHKVWPTNSDQEHFAKVVSLGSAANISEHYSDFGESPPRMALAYLYFEKAIREFLTTDDFDAEIDNRFLSIVKAIKESLQLIVIELEPGDDPQIIFETLNARGQALLPSDLIRNYVFMRITDKESNRLYQSYWQHFDTDRVEDADEDGENRFWHIDEQQGRLSRPRIDLFIFHYLVMKTESNIRIERLFKEFRDWRDGGSLSNEQFLADLKSCSGHFRRLIAPEGNSRLEVFARRLRSLDTSTVYPLLLFLAAIEGKPGTNEDVDKAIVDIESFMIRRFMWNLTPKNYNKFFVSVLVKAKAAHREEQSVADAIRAELLRSREWSARWPNDEEFEEGWCWKKLYVRSRPDRAVMVLSALETAMRSRKNERVKIQSGLTVEHLLPQQGEIKDYPYASDEEAGREEGDSPEEDRDNMLHTVGNLTLLTGSLNSSVSNGPWQGKVRAIVEDSDLRLNAWLRNDPPKHWDEAVIWDRSEELFDLALKVWPMPQE